jgi:UDPglucose 6-dehydrogenase
MCGADVVVLATDWEEFARTDPGLVGSVVAARNLIDARNVVDLEWWRALGWTVRCLGRG